MTSIDYNLLTKLFIAFIAATIIGTLSHELGHYTVARLLGNEAHINYSSTRWVLTNRNGLSPATQSFWITLGGPLQTIITGSVGYFLLVYNRKSFLSATRLTVRQWGMIFLALFWLRQSANLVTWILGYVVTGKWSSSGDELKLAGYLGLPRSLLMIITAVIGFLLLLEVIFRYIPQKQRITFIIAGFTGAATGYILWFYLAGKYLLP